MTTQLQPQPQPRDAAIAALDHSEGELVVNWADGRQSRFAAIWLLDNRPDGRHGPLGQRLFDVAELPEEPRIAAAALTESGDVDRDVRAGGHGADLCRGWLRRHALDAASRAERRRPPQLWDKIPGAAICRPASYPEVAANDRALAGWLADVRDYGFALLTRRADRARHGAAGDRAVRLCAGDQLRQAVRRGVGGAADQPRLYRPGARQPHRQSLSRSGAAAAAAALPGAGGGRRRVRSWSTASTPPSGCGASCPTTSRC